MKKSFIYLMSLLALGFASCDDSSDLGKAQQNPQEQVMTLEGVTIDLPDALAGSSLNLASYQDGVIPVLSVADLPEMAENAKVVFEMQIAADADYTNPITLQTIAPEETKVGSVYSVYEGEWNSAFRSMFGRAPEAQTNYIRFVGYIVEGDQTMMRLGEPDQYFAAKSLLVTPEAVEPIESAYYLIGDVCDWSMDNALRFDHSEQSVYDDPVFTLTFEVPEDMEKSYWKILPESARANANWAGVFGCAENGDTSETGFLIEGADGAMLAAEPGTYVVTINMEALTYSITHVVAPSAIYIIGAPQGWSIDSGEMALQETSAKSGVFEGVFEIGAGDFMFRFYSKLGNWDMNSIGSQNDDSPVEISMAGGTYSGPCFYQPGIQGAGKGSWSCPDWEGGSLKVTVDLNNLTVKFENAASLAPREIYVIGEPNGWDINSGAMALKETAYGTNVYKGTFNFPGAEPYFRFYTALGDWETNSIGAQEADSGVDVAYPYSGPCVYGKGSWHLLGFNGGNISLTVDLGAMTVNFE